MDRQPEINPHPPYLRCGVGVLLVHQFMEADDVGQDMPEPSQFLVLFVIIDGLVIFPAEKQCHEGRRFA
jgi:hypothetical protein